MELVHTWFQSPDIPLRSCVSVCVCVCVCVFVHVYFGVGWHISTPIFREKKGNEIVIWNQQVNEVVIKSKRVVSKINAVFNLYISLCLLFEKCESNNIPQA